MMKTQKHSGASIGLAIVLLFAATSGQAKNLLTADEALRLAFPGCSIARSTIFLSAAQKAAAEALAGLPIDSALLYPYRATCDGKPAGVAYFDAHRVRTLPERLMVVVAPSGKVARVEVLSFDEPQDYQPRRGWYEQFAGESLSDDLQLGKAIRNVAGATLTGQATAQAVRRVLALHAVAERAEAQ